MPTQELNLEKNSNGSYRCRWTDANGKRRCKTFGKVKQFALNQFNAWRTEWMTVPDVKTPGAGPMTVRGGWLLYFEHAKAYYRRKADETDGPVEVPEGEEFAWVQTGEAQNIEDAFKWFLDLHGDKPVASIVPQDLVDVQEAMVMKGRATSTINKHIDRIRGVFAWLVTKKHIEGGVWHALLAVAAVKHGRGVVVGGKTYTPIQPAKIKPAPDDHIKAVCSHLPPTIQAMIWFCFWTGTRPGEVCRMTTGQISTSEAVWVYIPGRHKTTHLGKNRLVFIGPNAQEVIRPYLKTDLSAPLFSVAEAVKERAAMKAAAYDPVKAGAQGDYRSWPSYIKRQAERETSAPRFNRFWHPRTFAHAIAAVCRDHNIPHWAPNQLRHNAATRARRLEGAEAARVILGHAHLSTTEIYAEPDLVPVIGLIGRVG